MKDLSEPITGTRRGRPSFKVGNTVALPCTMALLIILPAGVDGQAQGSGVPRFEFGAFFGAFNDESEYAPGGGSVQMDRGTVLGGHLGWILPSNLFVEADVGWSSNLRWVGGAFYTEGDATAIREMSSLTADLSVGYQLAVRDRIEVFGSAGGGLVRWDVDGIGEEPQASAVVGAGARVFLSRALAVRVGTRWRYVGDAMQGLRAVSGAATDRTALWTIEPAVGLSIVTGRGTRDTDGDGVVDPDDRCSATPTGAYVEHSGCPFDGDGDGVYDGLDACPDTPRGSRVDGRGCLLEAEEDTAVDDTDEDGVPDGQDGCPHTSPNSQVDESGCPVSRIQEDLEEDGRVVFHDVLFDFDMATPRPSAHTALDLVAEALLRNPHLVVEVQGHTDALGPDAYNRSLSERRAQAVVWYLQEKFPGLDGRLTARGYGESQPLASNETEAGRQQNRRVEFRVRQPPSD